MSAIEVVDVPVEETVPVPENIPAPVAKPSLLSVLRVRDFRLVWLGESVSLLGDQFYMIALPWLTLQLTGSGLALGTVAAVGGIPRAVFMLLGGVFTDRFSPRRVMLVSNAMRILLTAFVTAAVLGNFIQVWMLYVSALLFGLVDAFFIPAQSAIIPQIVERDQIEPANALTQIVTQLAGLVGPALAGLLIATLSGVTGDQTQTISETGKVASTSGIGIALAFDTLTFIIAAVALWLMKGGHKVIASERGNGARGVLQAIKEGIRIVWDDPLLRAFILVSSGINFLFAGTLGVGLPLLANTYFTDGATAMGFIFSGFGGGALTGALLAGSFPTPRRTGVSIMILIGLSGIFMSLFSVVATVPAAALVAVLIGLCVGYVNVMGVGITQKRVAPEAMGRVMSLIMLASFGLGPISNMIAGFLVDVSLSGMFIGAGVLLLLICLLALINRPIRTLVRA